MSKNLLFPKAEKLLIECEFTIIENERSYILGKDKSGNFVRFIYCEGINTPDQDNPLKKGKKK